MFRINGNAMFYEIFSKKTSSSIIQQLRPMTETETFCFIEVETNKCLMQHFVVV